MAIDLLEKIQDQRSSLSKGQRRIADFILAHSDRAAFMTALSLGEEAEVSESTVVRFATVLGFEGYPELQQALQESNRNRLTTVRRMELSNAELKDGVLHKVLTDDIDRIRCTMEMTSEEDFSEAVDALVAARKIYIVGNRSSRILASFLYFYLRLISGNAQVVGGESVSELFEQLLWVGPEDVVLGISFPRYSARTARALKYARSAGAKVIALTDSEASPLVPFAHHLLIAKSDITSFVDSLVAPMSMINALLAAVGIRKGHQAVEALEKLEHIWEEYQVYEKAAAEKPQKNGRE